MQSNKNSVTGEAMTIVICFNGMVSLQRVGKSADYKRTKSRGKYAYSLPTDPTVTCNVPNEDLDIAVKTTQCTQILKISEKCIAGWQSEGKNVMAQIDAIVQDIAQRASSGSYPLKTPWYIQTLKSTIKAAEPEMVVAEPKVIDSPKPKVNIEWIDHRKDIKTNVVEQVKFNGVVLNVVGHVDLSKFKK